MTASAAVAIKRSLTGEGREMTALAAKKISEAYFSPFLIPRISTWVR